MSPLIKYYLEDIKKARQAQAFWSHFFLREELTKKFSQG
jgi:hypothetical protein